MCVCVCVCVCGPGRCLFACQMDESFVHAMQPYREMEACFLSNLRLTVDAEVKCDCGAFVSSDFCTHAACQRLHDITKINHAVP